MGKNSSFYGEKPFFLIERAVQTSGLIRSDFACKKIGRYLNTGIYDKFKREDPVHRGRRFLHKNHILDAKKH